MSTHIYCMLSVCQYLSVCPFIRPSVCPTVSPYIQPDTFLRHLTNGKSRSQIIERQQVTTFACFLLHCRHRILKQSARKLKVFGNNDHVANKISKLDKNISNRQLKNVTMRKLIISLKGKRKCSHLAGSVLELLRTRLFKLSNIIATCRTNDTIKHLFEATIKL
jgi:hypothetical protein